MQKDARNALRQRDVQRRFDRAAAGFDDVDFVHRVTRDGLLERLGPMLLDVRVAVDLGCATGAATAALARQFRRALVISVDLSLAMLAKARQRRSWVNRPAPVLADALRLPVADHSVDLLFANLLLPWIDEPAALFSEAARVLRAEGLFLFSTLGPDSLLELRHAWQHVDTAAHVNHFFDMHDVGDAAVRAGLRDPVLDVDRLSVTYPDSDAVFADLSATGARNSLLGRPRGLVGRRRFAAMRDALEDTRRDGSLPLQLELVYGHCWGSGAVAEGGEFRISSDQITRRK